MWENNELYTDVDSQPGYATFFYSVGNIYGGFIFRYFKFLNPDSCDLLRPLLYPLPFPPPPQLILFQDCRYGYRQDNQREMQGGR